MLDLATTGDDLSLRVWGRTHSGSDDWTCMATLPNAHSRTAYSLSWSSNSQVIATGAGDDAIRLFTRSSSSPSEWACVETRVQAHQQDINCVAWSPVTDPDPSAALLASAGDDGLVRIWRWNNER